MTSDSRIAGLIALLAATRNALRDEVARLPADRLRERPGADRWSVAEVLEHLSIIETRVVAGFEQFVATAPSLPAGFDPEPSDYSGLLATLADRTRAVTAPEILRPLSNADAAASQNALEAARHRLMEALLASAGHDLTGLSRQHPVLGTLNGYEWIASLAGHEARHTVQIREIGDALE